MLQELKNLKVVIVTHVFATGPAQELEEYLKVRIDTLLFIGNPFSYAKDLGNFHRKYVYGVMIKEAKTHRGKSPELIMWLQDIIYTFLVVFFSKEKFDYYIGANNLNACIGIFLKEIGKVKRVIFYTVDYAPVRFENGILNYIYHKMDKFAVLNSDYVWNLSPRMEEARRGLNIVTQNQTVVPMGVHYERIRRYNIDEIDKNQIVYMGHLLEKQGVQLVIEAVSALKKEIAGIKFLVIGTGPYKEILKNKTKEMNLEDRVLFKGFIHSHEEIEDLIAKSAIAVALYNKELDKWTYYSDPGKLKVYLGAGVPVITTEVPWNAKEIAQNKCGLIVKYDVDELVKAIKFLLNENNLYNYRNNAREYARQFDWSDIFSRNLKNIL
jgi:glycosyltransferase involved in cell wall biosynthesis